MQVVQDMITHKVIAKKKAVAIAGNTKTWCLIKYITPIQFEKQI
jgi:hypothetical protein